MRSTFWPNLIFKPQSSQNGHSGLKFSPKRENSAPFMKIVQNALFRSCAARFGQIALLSGKVLKIVTLASNALQNGKTVRFPWKLYKTLFSGHAQHVLAKSHFWASKFSKSWNWPQILFETGKQCAFHENCTKRYFQVMRSTFWPNRIFERQSSQSRHIGLKFPAKRENGALSMKIVQNALFRSCAARFGQIAFLPSNFSKSLRLSQILFKRGKQCALHGNCTKRSFQVMRSTFWPNRIFKRQISQNDHTGLKFSPKRENSALSMKIVHENGCTANGTFRSFAQHVLAKSPNRIFQNGSVTSTKRSFKIVAFLSVTVLKIVKLAWNSLQHEKAVRFS